VKQLRGPSGWRGEVRFDDVSRRTQIKLWIRPETISAVEWTLYEKESGDDGSSR